MRDLRHLHQHGEFPINLVATMLLGFLIALASSISFGANRSFGSKALLSSPTAPDIATFVTLLTGVVVTFIILIGAGQAVFMFEASFLVLVLFALVGVLHFSIGRTFSYLSLRNIGANQVASLLSTQGIYSVVIAVVFLGEIVTFFLGVGIGIILAAIFLLEARKSATQRGGSIRIGYASGLVAGLFFGISPILIKIGLDIYPHFLAATFIAYVSSFIFHSVRLGPSKIKYELCILKRNILIYFLIMGVFAVISQFLRFAALSLATVVIVTPILSVSPVFTVLFTRIQAKKYEVFGPRTILSIIMVVVGAVLVSIASGF